MIGFLKGRVLPGGSILTAGGVGYEVRHCGAQAHSPGDEVELLVTTLTSREGAITLWSFNTRAEQLVFGALTGVPRVGPSAAGAILKGLGAAGVVGAVEAGDAGPIQAVKGVGKKTAESVVSNMQVPNGVAGTAPTPSVPASSVRRSVADALVAMGFDRQAVEAELAQVPAEAGETAASLTPVALARLSAVGA